MDYYNETLYKLRQDILDDIRANLLSINSATGKNGVSWETLTDGDNPDVFYIATEDYCIPNYICINSDNTVVVTFQNLPKDFVSEDGDGLFIEHLLDILDYLTAYVNEL